MSIGSLARSIVALRFLVLPVGLAFGSTVLAAGPTPSTTGCPMFHCTPEATGVMQGALLSHPTTVLSNSALGTMEHQGCSGDGPRLACLFTVDAVASGVGKGTLKVIDSTTLQPIWGSAGVANSYDIDPTSFSTGQVPLLFADGTLAAGDADRHVLYSSSGQVLKSLALSGRGKNMGMTPLSDKYGVITQSNGSLTLVDLATWTEVNDLTLKAEGNNVQLLSPSSASGGVLYAVGANGGSGHGFVFALSVQTDPRTGDKLALRATFTFSGKPAASAVVVKPQTTGFAGNLVLLYVPGLLGDPTPVDRLMGLLDNGSSTFSPAWAAPIVLSDGLSVAPAVDDASHSLFFRYGGDALVYRHDLLTGSFVEQYDIGTAAGYPSSFALNGHLTSNQYAGTFTLLLTGSYKQRGRGGSSAQAAVGFQPLASPTSALWSRKITDDPDSYTAGWVVGPATASPGYYCPIVIGKSSGITRICD